MILRLLFLAGLLATATQSPAAEPVRDEHVTAQLVAAREGVAPGQTLLVGLRLQHDPHWHTYWKTTATGYATDLEWDLPEGFSAGSIQWPVPQVYAFSGYNEYVYEGTVLLPVELTAPADLEIGSSVTLRATATWLMCAQVCIPGEVELSLTLPVVADAAPNPEWSNAFAEAERRQPIQEGDFEIKAWRADEETAVLQIKGDPTALGGNLYFFDEQTFIFPEESQTKRMPEPNVARLILPIDEAGVGEVERFKGVLRTSSSWTAGAERSGLAVDVPFQPQPPDDVTGDEVEGSASLTSGGASDGPVNFWTALAGAFLGGLILNLMPCVFPVIGIKIMGFVNQAGEDRRRIVNHGLVFTLGVLLSFWVLAGLLLFLRAGGDQLGWGFQLQNPGFVYLLAVFFLLFALNMSGVFEIGGSAVGVGSQLTGRQGYSGSFFSGILATVVATPCAAPLLGPALGIALALPVASAGLMFTAMALGLALPYLVLSAFPRLVKMLPRPGKWMESFKQFLAFLLYGTVGFLVWVLVGQLQESGGFTALALLWSIFGLVGVALAAWIYGRWTTPERPRRSRRFAVAGGAVVLLAATLGGYPEPAFDPASTSADAPAVQWETWEPGKAEALAEEGRLVYVDFTARWCVTCQSNKGIVFSSDAVRSFFKEHNVVALKADWTNRDPAIAEALQSFGRSAVPFNLIYAPSLSEPRILPEILTPGIVLGVLEEVRAADS